MTVIKKVDDVQINKGTMAANGLYNLSNEVTGELSYWFNDETLEELMQMDDEEFISESENFFQIAKGSKF